MKVVYNDKIINDSEFNLGLTDRGFQFGDGFFETFFMSQNSVPYFTQHYNRVISAFNTYNFNTKELPSQEAFIDKILSLCSSNKFQSSRIKMVFWRSEGGLYHTTNSKFNYLIISKKLDPYTNIKKTSFVLNEGINSPTPFSQFKPLSCFKYIYAGSSLKNYDDLIIKSTTDLISETLYSNIFWLKDNEFYTPDLKTGCINGIMRSIVINYLKEKGKVIHIGEYDEKILLNADEVFTTNSLKIDPIASILKTKFKVSDLSFKLHKELIGKHFQD